MSKLISMLQKENGRLSIARVASCVTFVLWVLTWAYTLLLGKSYAHFETVTAAMLVMFFVVLCSKSVDAKIIKVGD